MMKSTIKIGIIGGCLNTGWKSVSLNSIYHRLLAKKIKNDFNLRCRILLSDPHPCKLSAIIENVKNFAIVDGVDAILFQTRPYLFWGLHTPLWTKIMPIRRPWYGRLNPYLYLPQERISAANNLLPSLFLADLSWKLGTLLGLHDKGKTLLNSLFSRLVDIGRQKNIPIFFLSPIFGECYPDKARRHLQALFHNLMAEYHLDYIDLSELENQKYFELDQFHVNAIAHAIISEHVFHALTPWLRGVVAQGENDLIG